MSPSFAVQLVVDCASPHHLADWWAETLLWEVEHQDATFIRSMIDKGLANEADTARHNGALVWASASAIRPKDNPAGGQPRILFQQVPEAKIVKNRIHLDLRPDGPVDLPALHVSLIDRGATRIGEGAQGPHQWLTFADPEGNEFCVDR